MAGRAQELDDFVASKADWTVIHGDAKGWNLFFAKDPGIDQEADVVFIDMQWVGKGHPYQARDIFRFDPRSPGCKTPLGAYIFF